jgi:hypothetical protein
MIAIDRHKRNTNVAKDVTIDTFASVLPEAASKKAKIIRTLPTAVAHKSSKSVRFAEDMNDSYECDKSPEEIASTWITVSGLPFNNHNG